MTDNEKDLHEEELDGKPAADLNAAPKKNGNGNGKKNISSPVEGNGNGNGDDEALPDDLPAVSATKKKNMAILVVAVVVGVFIIYTVLKDKPTPEQAVKTEKQAMMKENRKAGEVARPDLANSNEANSKATSSASTALPGAQEQSNVMVPDAPVAAPTQNQGGNQINGFQATLPPPPTLPPVFDPTSLYAGGASGGGDGGAAAGGNAAKGAFNSKYTKPRQKLPEVDGPGGGAGDAPEVTTEAEKAAEEEEKKRITASMFVGSSRPDPNPTNNSGGSFSGGKTSGGGGVTASGNDEPFILNESSATKTSVTIRKNLEDVILQGKVIDAVMETAVNTDLPGKLRGVISRDVYSESGKRVVIPKGSRIIGSYKTDIKYGQARVYIIWTRVIRPDGVDAVLDSGAEDLIATDALGRTGVFGDLDNRFFELFGSSILLSSITVAVAVAADKVSGGNQSSTSTTPTGIGAGTTTTTSSPLSQGVSQAVTSLGSTLSNTVGQYINTKPRVTIDQGTKIKIFVNRDIIFPPTNFGNPNPTAVGIQMLN